MKKRTVEQMLKEIGTRRGMVKLSDDLNDDERELYLQEILGCPDCIAEAERIAGVQARRPRDH